MQIGEDSVPDRKQNKNKYTGVWAFAMLVISLISIKGLSLTPPVRVRPSFLRKDSQSVLWIVLFLVLWVGLTVLNTVSSRKLKKTALGIAFFYWFCSFLGYFLKTWGTVTFSEWEGLSNHINFVCYETGIFSLLYCFVLLLLWLADKYQESSPSGSLLTSSKLLFILSVCFLLVCWSPWFLQGAPMTATGDSNNIIGQANGMYSLMDNHPVLYTLYIRLLFKLAGSPQAGAFLYTILQLLISAAVFSACVSFADRVYRRKWITLGMLLWFGFYPIFPIYGIAMWKDIFFGVFICLIVLNICMLCLA